MTKKKKIPDEWNGDEWAYERYMAEKIYNLYEYLHEKYGDTQKIVAIEELSELQKELTKDLRGKGNKENIAQEIADVLIMIAQLIQIYDIEYEVEDWKDIKHEKMGELL